MPSGGGPVYQPTTVSYGGGGGEQPAVSPLRVFRKPRILLALLLFALIALAGGIAILATGITNWIEEKEIEREATDDDSVNSCVEIPIGVILGGVFLSCLGIVAMGIYLKVADWRRNCICPVGFFDKKQSLARQLQCQNGGGCSGVNQGIMALNPSTDPLVSHTQYAPVSELPSLRVEDEERRNLMPDSKDCFSSAEESDRMLEPDPRIVLRPMGRVEDA